MPRPWAVEVHVGAISEQREIPLGKTEASGDWFCEFE
jgi:hypothetical protein